MRRAFTLVELLVIVAIIGVMVTAAVVSIVKGQRYARMKGSVRTVFATVRQARSIALVSQKPCVLTFSTKNTGDGAVSSVTITSAELIKPRDGVRARSLSGNWIVLGETEEESVADQSKSGNPNEGTAEVQPPKSNGNGQTLGEFLFEDISKEVLEGICIKVEMSDEIGDGDNSRTDEFKRSKISVFSNADFLIGKLKKSKEQKEKEESKDPSVTEAESVRPVEEETAEETKSVVWQINGRCEPHTIYIYPEDGKKEDAWRIRVDRFGGVKILEDEDD
ncbi:MAG: type II secretion system protein [Kiritimatiellae bacterium]|nr:type II secretion system protein [Kiritimatiellia bacterium]